MLTSTAVMLTAGSVRHAIDKGLEDDSNQCNASERSLCVEVSLDVSFWNSWYHVLITGEYWIIRVIGVFFVTRLA
eukprot:5394613-Pyramimonas_sp.AAC.1